MQHHLGNETPKQSGEYSGPVEHAFEIKIVKLRHFKPPNNQVSHGRFVFAFLCFMFDLVKCTYFQNFDFVSNNPY